MFSNDDTKRLQERKPSDPHRRCGESDTTHPVELSLEFGTVKAVKLERSCDPYNSSGGFDRNKNWERVRKR